MNSNNNTSEENTISRLKALNEPALICNHILQNRYLNLNFPDSIEDDEAWCNQCDAILQKEGKWTEKLLKFADFQPYCKDCFRELKKMQQTRQSN